jgi:hypothetical protein
MQLAGKNRSAGVDDCAPLVIRRGELGPGERELQSPHAHLVFVSLGGGAVVRSDARGSVRHRLRPGCVALHPAGHFARWRRSPLRSASATRAISRGTASACSAQRQASCKPACCRSLLRLVD